MKTQRTSLNPNEWPVDEPGWFEIPGSYRYGDHHDGYVRRLHEANVPVRLSWSGHYWYPTARMTSFGAVTDDSFDELLAFAVQKREQSLAAARAAYWPKWQVLATPKTPDQETPT